ncbi:MAG: hypothetical protein HEQ37_05015 [Acidovorax sp.]|nr:hypothetical protein [Acidovorax sp.]
MRAAIAGIQALLAGQPRNLQEIPLDMSGISPFHQRVYAVTRAIAPGQTLTYGEVAVHGSAVRTCSKSFWSCTSALPGWAARRGAPPIARAIGKRRNAADRPARHLPEGLE